MYQPTPDQILAAQSEVRVATDYRFNWGTYIGWTILSLGFYSYYGLYHLIDRRTQHAKRRIAFCAALWHALAGRADTAGKREQVQSGLDNLSRVHATLQEYEARNARNPLVLLIMRLGPGLGAQVLNGINVAMTAGRPPSDQVSSLAPIYLLIAAIAGAVGAYINHVLNADLRFYEEWEDAMFANATWIANEIGIPAPPPQRARRHPRRETVLYVFLSVITFGIFAIAWRAMMMKDGNIHFDGDDRSEDALLISLGIKASVQPMLGLPGVMPPMPPMPPLAR